MTKKYEEMLEYIMHEFTHIGLISIVGIAGCASALGFSTLLEFIIKLIKRIWK